ncbi:peroxisome biogenesis protein [Saccharomycopsis crataegensis]|uniref:Peroxisome biogenesis protein n=1 Tax=Saccharomycopsis crataegensis TaxID=43959 RepID=A0AAV5QG55_9ASCO|nr:peroxisome biogenesis protein [Saccharomycopsis crataegensis]
MASKSKAATETQIAGHNNKHKEKTNNQKQSSSAGSEEDPESTRASFARLYTSPNDEIFNKETKSSPLLATTPPTVSKALIRSYPYLLIADYFLGVLTWTNDDVYLNLACVSGIMTFILYFNVIVTYFGHVLIVLILFLYFLLIKNIQDEQEKKPTLDNIVQVLTKVSIKADLLLAPITTLNLTQYDLKRLLLTIIFLSPIYVMASHFIFGARSLISVGIFYLLTYHSLYSRVTRRILWKSKTVRLLCFYATGLNFEKGSNAGLFSNVMAKVKQTNNITSLSHSNDGKPIRFTYVIHENQRKWLGIGWTSNLLNYERAPWTDEFLNESPTPDDFKLPDYNEDGEDLVWRWVDTNWRLDLTNDGALTLKNPKKNTKVDPAADDGYVYYDNTWKRPSSEDSFGKYTRRRRWLRTAELVHISRTNQTSTLSNGSLYLNETMSTSPISPEIQHVQASGIQATENGIEGFKKRRSIRFDTRPVILEEPKSDGSKKMFNGGSVLHDDSFNEGTTDNKNHDSSLVDVD